MNGISWGLAQESCSSRSTAAQLLFILMLTMSSTTPTTKALKHHKPNKPYAVPFSLSCHYSVGTWKENADANGANGGRLIIGS